MPREISCEEFEGLAGNRPTRYKGRIGISDQFFLTAFISILAPRRVVEIGILTGFPAAIIAAALQRQYGPEREPDQLPSSNAARDRKARKNVECF